ncbi:hypothetical protein [Undibacterium sp. YM2]|uniref:hypothetical protein n=1 Tax=Undibacterium sp. YM2 TaxID=2058625 RepID=UPI001389B272|nr:hypothetical protein [Undibacterium sp. YM2]
MKKLFRLFLLCVLMLAVPMQAALAASRICCVTQHQQTSGEHLHAHHADESAQQAHKAHQATIDHDASGEECCIAAAILNTPLPTASLRPTSEKIDLFFSSYAGHIGDCPDKPPRF